MIKYARESKKALFGTTDGEDYEEDFESDEGELFDEEYFKSDDATMEDNYATAYLK